MSLREEFERQGTWLFRWRSYLPAGLVIALLAGMADFEYPDGRRALQDQWEALCLAVSALGLVVRALVIGHVPRGTSGRNTAEGQVAEVLNVTGMYDLVRHPLYLGNFLMWLGVAMLPRSGWLLVVVTLSFWLYYERIMFAEEEFLRRKFGAVYEKWAARTPAFLPRLGAVARALAGHWARPTLPFSFRNVLKREYSGILAVAVLFAGVDILAGWISERRAALDLFGAIVFAVGIAVYVLLRILKRRTRLLNVEGR